MENSPSILTTPLELPSQTRKAHLVKEREEKLAEQRKQVALAVVGLHKALMIVPQCRAFFDVNLLKQDPKVKFDRLDLNTLTRLGKRLLKEYNAVQVEANILAVRLNDFIQIPLADKNTPPNVVQETCDTAFELTSDYQLWAEHFNSTVHNTIIEIIDCVNSAKETEDQINTDDVKQAVLLTSVNIQGQIIQGNTHVE